MSWIDIAIISIISLSALISFFRGFVREAFSLLVWVVAFVLGWLYFQPAADLFIPWINVEIVRVAAGFLTILLSVLILGAIIGYFLGQLVDKTGLSGTDRLLGILFGAARGVLLVAALVFLATLTPAPDADWWQASVLVGPFQNLALWSMEQLPPDMLDRLKAA
jgi:membrane protein required for colicin V production